MKNCVKPGALAAPGEKNKQEIVLQYKTSIHNSPFSAEQVSVIWDFYVTKSVAASASQRRKASDYGCSSLPFSQMIKVAEMQEQNAVVLLADRMPKTLQRMNLQIIGEKGAGIAIDIETPRLAVLLNYSISDDGAPRAKNDCGKAEGLLTHIRNSLAHGNTYFFSNGNLLLEDKNGSTTTAMILIKQKTLLDWIKVVDFEERYYKIVDTSNEKET